MERNTFLNVSSPGFTSRIMDRASESYTLKRRKVPILGFSRLPLLNPSRNIKSSSFIRIAPPEPRPIDINEIHSTEDNENKDPKRKSILQTLNEASKKRSYEQDQNGCENFIRKKRKEDYRKVQNKRSHEVSWIDEERTSDGERKRSKRSDNRSRSSEIKADIIVDNTKDDTIEEKTASLDINKEDRSVARMLSFTSSMSIIAPHITRDVSFDRALENSRDNGEYQKMSNSKNEITVIADVEPIPRNLDVFENMDTTVNSNVDETKDNLDTLPTGRVFNRMGMRIPRHKDRNDDIDMMMNPIASKITETNQSNENYEEKLLDDAYGSITRGEGIDRSRLRRVMNMIKDPPKNDASTLRSILSSPSVKKSPFQKQVTFSVPIIEGNNTINSKTDNVSLEPGTSTLSFTSVNRIDTSEREFETPKDIKQFSSTNSVNDQNDSQLLQKEEKNKNAGVGGCSVESGDKGHNGKLNFVNSSGSKESAPEATTNSSNNLIKTQVEQVAPDVIDAPNPLFGVKTTDAEPKTLSSTITFATSTQPSLSTYSTSTTSTKPLTSFPSFVAAPSTSLAQSPNVGTLASPAFVPLDNTVQLSTSFGTTTQPAVIASSTVPSSAPLFNAFTQASSAFGVAKEPPAFNSVNHSLQTSNTITTPTFGLNNTPSSISTGLFGTTQSLTTQSSTAHSMGTPAVFGSTTQSSATISSSHTSATTSGGTTVSASTSGFPFNSQLNANAPTFEAKGFSLCSKQNSLDNPQTSSSNPTEKTNVPFGNSQFTPSFGTAQSPNIPTFSSAKSGTIPSFGNIPLAPVSFGTTQATSTPTFGISQSTSTTTFGTTIQNSSAFDTTQTTSATVFGNTQQNSAPAFGTIQPGSGPAFGTVQPTTASAFSTTQPGFMPTFRTPEQSSKPAFEMTTANSTPAFGNTQQGSAPSFGSVSLSTNSLFGAAQPSSTVGFDTNAPSAASAHSTPAFGSFNFTTKTSEPSTFGTPTSTAGQSSVTIAGFGSNIGQSPFGSATGASTLFGSTKEAAPTATTSQTTIQASKPAGGFVFSGASNTTSTFGTTNNAVPPFGSSVNPNTFGTANSTSTFGSSSNQPSMFSSAVKQEATFGNSPGVSSVFGASSFGASSNQPTFGASSNQPAFGAPVKPQPVFNIGQPAFGSNTQPNNPVFNFGSSQNTNQPVFTFGQGTSTNTQTGTQPFTFNAAAPVTQPSTGGMFSIGSTTASRSRNARLSKRR